MAPPTAHPPYTGSSAEHLSHGSSHGTNNTTSGTTGTTTKAPRRSSVKSSHSRSYPRGVGLDFRKLAGLTLVSYIDHHGVSVRPEAPPSELAVAVARHFEQLDVEEEDCIGGFLERLEQSSAGRNSLGGFGSSSSSSGTGGTSGAGSSSGGSSGSGSGNGTTGSGGGGVGVIMTDYARKTAFFDGRTPPASVRKRKRNKWAARPGEQVAAKVTRTDENGSWILASVQRFYADTETYDVQDEDDTSKLIRLPWSHVMRLSTGSEGCFQKGADCMAIFPETTSFYKAKVSKPPVWKLLDTNSHRSTPSYHQGNSSSGAGGSGSGSGNSSSNHHHHHHHGHGGGIPTVKEIIVKFEDDEDAQGKTPHRRVPSRYVIPIPPQYFYDENDDVDLTPPGSK